MKCKICGLIFYLIGSLLKAMVLIELLKNISKNEIHILSAIYTSLYGNNLRYNKNSYVDGNVVREHLCLSKEEYELAILNLFRLYCCEGFHQEI